MKNPRTGKFDSHFRDLNHVITNSRPQNQKKEPCVLLNTDEDPGSDSNESQLQRDGLIKTSRSKSPEKFFSWKKQRHTSENDDVMIISPKNKTRKKQIQSDRDDANMAGSKKTPQKSAKISYQKSVMNHTSDESDSDDDDMAGSKKTPQKSAEINYQKSVVKRNGDESDSDDNVDLANLMYSIEKGCLPDNGHFCEFANDYSKCYRNSVLQVLLSCDMILQSIRTHKQDVPLLPCSEFDNCLFQFYDKSQKLQRMSIDKEFVNNRCTRGNLITADSENNNILTLYAEQSPTDYLSSMFVHRANTKEVVADLMSHRILTSRERKNCDGSVT